jgi:hypothetical protein
VVKSNDRILQVSFTNNFIRCCCDVSRGGALIFKVFVALTLCATWVLLPALSAQQQATSVRPGLKIVVLDGEGATNALDTRTVEAQPVVEVRDENERPVSGARVVFELPAVGPSGHFAGQALTFETRTNSQGQAAAVGFTPNLEIGKFNIKVSAADGDRTGSAVIHQTNASTKKVVEERKSRKGLWAVLIGGGAGAAVLAFTLGGGGNGSSGTPGAPDSLTISPGSITVGGPR